MTYYIEDMSNSELISLCSFNKTEICTKRGKKPKFLKPIYAGFDIETTNLVERETTPKGEIIIKKNTAYMYIWQFSLDDHVVIGHTWDDFVKLLSYLKICNQLDHDHHMIVFIANMSFEFQFLRKWVTVEAVLAKEERKPMFVLVNECFEFRDALQITGGSLAFLAENYTTTQKLKGDLDYSIQRNKSDGRNLTPEELQYCLNDVLILSEFSKYIFDTYIIPTRKCPYTKTGILRAEVKAAAPKGTKDAIQFCMVSEELYHTMMMYLFRGGYVHGNLYHMKEVLPDVMSQDETSAYPAHMQQIPDRFWYPMGKFFEEKKCSWGKLIHLCRTDCVFFEATFYNVKATSDHSIESESKCVALDPLAIIDNGRVREAAYMTVWLTELDLDIYNKFYSFDLEKTKLHRVYHTTRGTLPDYLVDTINRHYINKANLKTQGLTDTTAYAVAKANINSAYGLTVQRMVEQDIGYDNESDEWILKDNFSFDKEVKKLFLLPQWGIWVTAHARWSLLTMVHKIVENSTGPHDDVVYCDTDSIKLLNYEKHKHLFEEYNESLKKDMKKYCEKKGLDYTIFESLGTFEFDGRGKAKFLGAKRYITDLGGKVKCTIAGLPKKSLEKYCKDHKLDIWKTFDNYMSIPFEFSDKLTTAYHDEPTSDMINGELMEERSSVCLFEVPFTLKLDDTYLGLLTELKRQKARYERRID